MCTAVRFTDDQGNMFDYGQTVLRTPGDAAVPAAFERPDDPARGHDVIGVGITALGVPLYFDCANDAGLAVAGLNFPQSARYAADSVDGSFNVAAYEFPYWVARNFGSVAEARAALTGVTVVAKAVSDKLPVANLHWIVADATGAIVVECMEDGLRVWEDDVDVLTNEPNFGWHRQNLRNYLTLTDADPAPASWGGAELRAFGSGEGLRGVPGDYSGPSRFVKVAFVNAQGLRAHGGRLLREDPLHQRLLRGDALVLLRDLRRSPDPGVSVRGLGEGVLLGRCLGVSPLRARDAQDVFDASVCVARARLCEPELLHHAAAL